jgi:hypothetical protein
LSGHNNGSRKFRIAEITIVQPKNCKTNLWFFRRIVSSAVSPLGAGNYDIPPVHYIARMALSSLHEPAKRAAAGWCVDMVDLNSLSSADEGILLRALSAAEAR